MRETRKQLFVWASVTAMVASVASAFLFAALFFNWFSLSTLLLNSLESAGESVLNVVLVYLFTGIVANIMFCHVYVKYGKQNYYQIYHSAKGILLLFVLQFLVSVPVLFSPAILFYLAFMIKPNQNELVLLNTITEENKKQTYFKQIIARDPRLFVMSVQIQLLKSKLKNKEITLPDYHKLLNDILTNGVS